MKILAWDTSSKTGAVVAMECDTQSRESRLLAEFTLNVDSTHSEKLLWGIHQTLGAVGWKLDEVDVLGVGVGPGSFTGLRIGITTARTLGQTLKKPVVEISSLRALARPAALIYAQECLDSRTIVVVATDACKGELFALWGSAEAILGRGTASQNAALEEVVIQPSLLMEAVRKKVGVRGKKKFQWIGIGEGRARYLEEWEKLPSLCEVQAPLPYLNHIQGRFLGILACEEVLAGHLRDALDIHPRYLRASDAELKLKAGLLRAPTL